MIGEIVRYVILTLFTGTVLVVGYYILYCILMIGTREIKGWYEDGNRHA